MPAKCPFSRCKRLDHKGSKPAAGRHQAAEQSALQVSLPAAHKFRPQRLIKSSFQMLSASYG